MYHSSQKKKSCGSERGIEWCLGAGNEQLIINQSSGHLKTTEIWIKDQCKTQGIGSRRVGISTYLVINVPSCQGLVLEFYPTLEAVQVIVPPRLDIMFHSLHTSGLPTRVVPHYLGPGSVLRSRDFQDNEPEKAEINEVPDRQEKRWPRGELECLGVCGMRSVCS